MKKLFVCVLLCALFPIAHAEDGVLEFWTCELKEGKTTADAKVANGKWLKHQNAANPGANVRSWGLVAVVGDSTAFGYMDAYPTLDAWAKSKAAIDTPEGAAIEAELNAVADCSKNRLYRTMEH